MLAGVGDKALGEWSSVTPKSPYASGRTVVHVRRRLTLEEEILSGPVRDIRGTSEMEQRVAAMCEILHCTPAEIYRMEPSLREPPARPSGLILPS